MMGVSLRLARQTWSLLNSEAALGDVSDPVLTSYRRLLPGHRFDLRCCGPCNPRRVLRLFRDVWRRIPLGDRREICQQIRNADVCAVVSMMWAIDEGAWARCRDGTRIEVWSVAADAMPDPVLSALFAHELAHIATDRACPELPPLLLDKSDTQRYLQWVSDIEAIANRKMEGWGFSANAVRVWERSHAREIRAAERRLEIWQRTVRHPRGGYPVAIASKEPRLAVRRRS